MEQSRDSQPAVVVRELEFRYRAGLPAVLRGVDLEVPSGCRCLLVGANGAGKTTLLRVLAGKHMVPQDRVRVLGRPAFHDTSLAGEVEYLGGPFPFEVDVGVAALLEAAPAVPPRRRDALLGLLGVDLRWRMHSVSDGQRRRVQILLGLLSPSRLLLMDEITTELDLLARCDLLAFLREESEQQGCTILYATHILDRLEAWATHIAYMAGGRVQLFAPLAGVRELAALAAAGESAPLVALMEGWLRRDLGR